MSDDEYNLKAVSDLLPLIVDVGTTVAMKVMESPVAYIFFNY